ncbi:MAG: secretin N-terminal domain-containing protein, partial [Planctomycetota bacterium]
MLAGASVQASPGSNASDKIKINFPESVELSTLVDFVSDHLQVNIIYDQQSLKGQVMVRSPKEIPAASLLEVLNSALRVKGFVLVDAEEDGWKQVIATRDLPGSTRAIGEGLDAAPVQAGVVTQVIGLRHAEAEDVKNHLQPFLTSPGANVVTVAGHKMLIVTDLSAKMGRVARLINLLDRPPAEIDLRFVTIRQSKAQSVAQQVRAILESRRKMRGGGNAGPAEVEVAFDERVNRVILVGSTPAVDAAHAVARELDADLGMTTAVYSFSHTDPKRFDDLIRQLVSPIETELYYRSTVDPDAGYIVASTTATIHEQITRLIESVDVEPESDKNPVQFYKLRNTNAAEVLNTIETLGDRNKLGRSIAADSFPMSETAPSGDYEPEAGDSETPVSLFDGLAEAVEENEVMVTADQNTNSIIVIAPPPVQRIYQQLIESLDRRRPQVMLEATIVAIDTSDSFSLGVEILAGESQGETQSLVFSAFGLSQVDTDNASLVISPSLGLNGSVITSNIADVVIKALKSDGRAKVVSAPKILINDNATGSISSVVEQPFTSINQGENTDTVTFGGFVDAGTNITATPRIAEGDHLRIELEIALNSFSGEGAEGIPA